MEIASIKSNENSALYILGYKPYPSRFPHIEWKLEWFPKWFFDIEHCFQKIVLPQANIRLERVLETEHVHRIQPFPTYLVAIKRLEDEMTALKASGVNAILNGDCRTMLTNVSSYAASTGFRDTNGKVLGWGHVLETDNYGRVLRQTMKNEFDNYEPLATLAEHLDTQLSEYFWSHGIWRDEIEKL